MWVEDVAKEVRDKLPTTNLEGLIRNWDKIRGSNTVIAPAPLETELNSLTCSELGNWTLLLSTSELGSGTWIYV